MASVVIRSVLGPAALPWSRIPPLVPLAVFESVATRRLHQGRPLLAEATGTGNIEKAFPELVEDKAAVPPSASAASSTASLGTSSTSTLSTTSSSAAAARPAPTRPSLGHVPTVNLTPPPPTASTRPRATGTIKFRWQPESQPFQRHPQFDVLPTHTLSVKSTRNNVVLTFSDRIGPVVPSVSGGTGKNFKKAGRASYESAHQAALKMFDQIMDFASYRGQRQEIKLRVAMKGMFGQGREAVGQAITGAEGTEINKMMVTVEDRTPVKIGGTRARKPRRL